MSYPTVNAESHAVSRDKTGCGGKGAPSARSFGETLSPPGQVIDIFCGAGALSYGFRSQGFEVACGYDIDESCRYPFEANNKAPFVRRDVTALEVDEVRGEFDPSSRRILIGCAPCQPFSSYSQGRQDPQWQLLKEFARLAIGVEPDVVSMENVPRLATFRRGVVFNEFVEVLGEAGYRVKWTIVNCAHFGVPQTRSRLVLVASRHGEPDLPRPTHSEGQYSVVRDVIADLPAIQAGTVDPTDSLHRASGMSVLNLQRIQASTPGGTWRDWEPTLVTDCHRKETGSGYVSVYGRMDWDRLAPTITTQFYGFGNGRFGHPDQDRAISLREGAMLQTFPRDYTFAPLGASVSFNRIGRLVGNAVPVALASAIAQAIARHLEEVS